MWTARHGRCTGLIPALAAAFSLAACASGSDSPPLGPPEITYPAVLLVSPASGGAFRQNDLTIGCQPHPDRGSGFRLTFDWAEVAGATRYKVVFWHRGSQFPAVEGEVTASQFESTECNSFVIDRNLHEWVWKVAALGPIPPIGEDDIAPRDTVLWSEERVFRFEPCRLGDGRPCNAPPPPTAGSWLDLVTR